MIMLRHSDDDFNAMKTATAMESVGAEVVSVTYNGMSVPTFGDIVPSHPQFIVWARVQDGAHCDLVDEAIEKSLDGGGS